MSLLKTAVKSHIPLIAVTTRDTVYVEMVLKHLLGKSVDLHKADMSPNGVAQNAVHFLVLDSQTDLNDVQSYRNYAKKHATLIVVNPPKIKDGYLNCGEIPVPKDLLKATLKEHVPGDQLDLTVQALGGCTIKEAVQLAMLTQGRDGSITSTGLTQTRKSFFHGSQGLTQIDPQQFYYQPSPAIADWISKNKKLFFYAPDIRLQPRGVLFTGKSGTGKTEGAKFIAKEFGVPLYRLDIASTKNKYVGESAANLQQGLSRIDAEEPCVVLFDEVEKVFAKGDHNDASTTTDMLSLVLWWLAEHRTRVLAVMTSNDEKKLPVELYREGRINKVFNFEGLLMEEAETFLQGLVETYKIKNLPKAKVVQASLSMSFGEAGMLERVSHAALTEQMNSVIATLLQN